MTVLDFIVIILIGLGIFTGWRRGFTKAVLSLGVWVLVIVAVWLLQGPLSRLLAGAFGSAGYLISFLIIFLGVLIGGKIVAGRIAKGVRGSFIGPVDRLLGASVGALKGLIFATLFFMSFSFFYDMIWGRAERRPRWIADAVTYPLVNGTANLFGTLVAQRYGSEPANAPAASEKQRPRRKQ